MGGNSLRPSLRTRVKNAMGNMPSSLYYSHSRVEINFGDSKSFVDHEELSEAKTMQVFLVIFALFRLGCPLTRNDRTIAKCWLKMPLNEKT